MILKDISTKAIIGAAASLLSAAIIAWVPPVRHWLALPITMPRWVPVVAVGACAFLAWKLYEKRQPKRAQDKGIVLFGVRWILKAEFFSVWKTSQLSNSDPHYLAALIVGPTCIVCGRDITESIGLDECNFCGHKHQLPSWCAAEMLKDPRQAIRSLKLTVYREAQAMMHRGELWATMARR